MQLPQSLSVNAERLQIVLPGHGKRNRTVRRDDQRLTIGAMHGECRFALYLHILDVSYLTDPKPGEIVRGNLPWAGSVVVRFGIVTPMIHDILFHDFGAP